MTEFMSWRVVHPTGLLFCAFACRPEPKPSNPGGPLRRRVAGNNSPGTGDSHALSEIPPGTGL